MNGRSGFSEGGFIGGDDVQIVLDDAECVLDTDGRCARIDQPHYRERIEIHTLASVEPVAHHFGSCQHTHVDPVLSFDGAEHLANLCRGCGGQLSA